MQSPFIVCRLDYSYDDWLKVSAAAAKLGYSFTAGSAANTLEFSSTRVDFVALCSLVDLTKGYCGESAVLDFARRVSAQQDASLTSAK
jgi:hypothetical protein